VALVGEQKHSLMVKKGPCSHCGVTHTPLWHDGPTEKPVLCSDCGSQYKLKGNLDNYFPKNPVVQSFHNKFTNVNGGKHLNVDVDQLSNYVPPTTDEDNNKSTPNVHCISAQATPLLRNGLVDKSVLHKASELSPQETPASAINAPKKLQLQPLIHKNFRNVNGGSSLNVEDEDQLSNHITPASDGDNNKSTPNVQHISPQDFGSKIPSRKRSRVVYLTPLKECMEELWKLHRNYGRHAEERILEDNVNNFIPENEIAGLGAILLKTDHDVAASADTCESSTDD
ncbi:GATA transcription factor 26, partial [Glycine soja]